MIKEEIITTIENAPDREDHSTEMLVFYDSTHAYCIHGMKWSERTDIVVTNLYPGRIHQIDEIPEDIENMKSLWYDDLMCKFGDIYEAMRLYKTEDL